ncbi:MAG: right-handed parallel beta-helix repeat-containing protein [Thermoplasmata archaeon]|nr:MAG: right-handed parallel beta-helix repeat-containing protein [Thermoplasmata archaeon]
MSNVGSENRKFRSIVIIFFLLLNFIVIPSTDSNGDGIGDYPPPNNGDWIIRNETSVSNETILLLGNLEVEENASLTLSNVTLLINSSIGDIHGIYVDKGGSLNVYNSNISNLSGPYIFTVDGDMILESSLVSNMLYGIDIEYGDVFIANSTIYNKNQYNMYGLKINGSPTLINNYIHSNHRGIAINFGGAPLLINNTITSNNYGVVSIAYGFATLIRNNISYNILGGITVELGHFEIHNNKVASNGGFGIESDHASINATNNTIYDNERWGIFSWGAPLFLENNTYDVNGMHNGEGDVLLEWDVLIKVFDQNNESIESVDLTIKDDQGDIVWSGTTIGNVRTLVLREYEIVNGGTLILHSPYRVSGTKDNFSNTMIVDVKENRVILVTIEIEKDEFPLWGLLVVIGIWMTALILIIIGLILNLRNKRGRLV